MEEPSKKIFDQLLARAQGYLLESNLEILKKAYQFSQTAHQHQLRAGGSPYITHPLEVAIILSEFHLDLPTLTAALLHDVLEDTSASPETLKKEFGEEVAHIVEGVTKIASLEEIHSGELLTHKAKKAELLQQAENWRKMLIATAHDIRVILLKLADRLHNMQTLESLEPERKKRIAEETLTLYAPMAQRLGIYQMKSQLEDLSFKILEPELYSSLKQKLAYQQQQREEQLKKYMAKIEEVLGNLNFPYKISARPKNLYSIYRKMLRQNKSFEEIQDLSGVRILTDTVEHCYALLGMIHNRFTPLPNTFTDYIAVPKNNLYQSLHTTIEMAKGEIVEIQIRTEEMHQTAEYGIAAHWRYKLSPQSAIHSPQKNNKDSVDERLDWLKHLLEWQSESKKPEEFLEDLKVELQFDQVFVFTPKGEVKKLPQGSTPVDFAYAVHTEIGHQCIGAKINNKMVRLDTKLKSGDQVEILLKKGGHPHKDWLNFVRTPRAKAKIRKFFREH